MRLRVERGHGEALERVRRGRQLSSGWRLLRLSICSIGLTFPVCSREGERERERVIAATATTNPSEKHTAITIGWAGLPLQINFIHSLLISLYILLILGRIIVSSTLSYHQGIPD